jgi:hypothetical protein
MWAELWLDFNERALALLDGHLPHDAIYWENQWQQVQGAHFDANPAMINEAINWTIRWQLISQPPYLRKHNEPPNPIQLGNLHLPELYSGHPWALNQKPWVAFVTINPSRNPLEIFPTRAHLPQNINNNAIQHLISFFEERFDPGPIALPLIHGLNLDDIVAYAPQPTDQKTWSSINKALIACLDANHILHDPVPLGRRAAVIDVVPWKFKAWGNLPYHFKNALIAAATQYVHWTLHEHPPAFIVAAGEHARKAMHLLFPQLPPYVPNVPVQVGVIEINGQSVQWRGVPAPTAHGNAFGPAMQAICGDLGTVLAL